MTEPTPEKMLTVQEIAKLLDVSDMTVYRLIEHQELVAFRVGRSFRIDPRDFAEYMRHVCTRSDAA